MSKEINTGLQGYSSPNDQHIILCLDDQGRRLEFMRYCANRNIAVIATGNGSYKGHVEPCYVLKAGQFFLELCVETFARFFQKQESVLLLDTLDSMNWRDASLVFADGNTQSIGVWHEVTKDRALKEEAWTEINGHWYICQENPADCLEEEHEREITQLLYDAYVCMAAANRRLQSRGMRKSPHSTRTMHSITANINGKTLINGKTVNAKMLLKIRHKYRIE